MPCSGQQFPEPVLVDQPVIALPAGQFRAERFHVGDSTYLRLRGVQYAQHPEGPLRWQPPVPLSENRTGIVDALSFGKDCIQGNILDRYDAVGLHEIGEDCLYLNVWAPRASAPLPVLFWIHGGSFTNGGSSRFSGDGMMMLRRDAILVTSNYRLGAMGFLAGDAVKRSSSDGSAGNFALQDNREALRWVKRNIASLGGDPSRVTIFGQSSGGSHVTTHMVMPRSAGLFSGAIAQSGAWDNFTVQAVDAANNNFHMFAQHAGCGKAGDDDQILACLRRKPLRTLFGGDIMSAIANTSKDALFGPTVDGVELIDVPENLAARGFINKLSGALLGTAHDEGRFMLPLTESVPGGPFSTESEFLEWLKKYLQPEFVEEAFALYPASDYGGSWWSAAAAVYTDQQYTCPTARSVGWLIRSGSVPADNAYTYQVAYASEGYKAKAMWLYFKDYCLPGFTPHGGHLNHILFPCPEISVDMGVGHGAEIDFLFPHVDTIKRYIDDITMAEYMQGWWQSFATSYKPTIRSGTSLGNTSLNWSPFAAANETFILTPRNPRGVVNIRDHFCEFWDRQHPMPYGTTPSKRGEGTQFVVV